MQSDDKPVEFIPMRRRFLCQCNLVTEKDILDVVREEGSFDFDVVQQHTSCSTSCGTCKPVIMNLLENLKNAAGKV